ncbi:hypothetical protein C2S53_004328 [Perilla frutescens var. hirtella]|uniref:F-box domain-containing protein n=1 Tax=Perilla frutescens var. hirtella TaxID=608512 RepID=A0AAD4INP0_PERFH|nr:hypothetical protein C2S53_004328 [Perilla frutescens var. hirtella]
MSSMPCDIVHNILMRVDAESLFGLRSVCKQWNDIICEPSFVKSHTNYHSQCYEEGEGILLIRESLRGALYSVCLDSLNYADTLQTIDAKQLLQPCSSGTLSNRGLTITSCNGLILFYGDDFSDTIPRIPWVIWNPLLQQLHNLPDPYVDSQLLANWTDHSSCGSHDLWSMGFGYNCHDNDYKVVRIARLRCDGLLVQKFIVYSLKLGSWRIIKDCPFDFSGIQNGVFLDGALHWRSFSGMIIMLDLATEEFRQLPGPPVLTTSIELPHFVVKLDSVGGFLLVSCYYHDAGRFDGWIFNHSSWTKLFSIEEEDILAFTKNLSPVVYLHTRRKLLLKHERGFFWFDLAENKSVKKVTIHGLSMIYSNQFGKGSLFRLHPTTNATSVTVLKRWPRPAMEQKIQRADAR